MRSRSVCAALLLVTALLPVSAPLPAQGGSASCAAPLALVLSGGGAKGFAHIGVLQALDAAGIHPDLIVGTSMGALLGTLYASGASGNALDSLVHAPVFTDLLRRQPQGMSRWGGLLPLVSWSEGDHGFAVQGAAWGEADPDPALNAALLRANLIARGEFSRLPTPLAVVATDLRTRGAVILRQGDLVQAVRASIAVPLVLAPVEVGGRLLADGGLSANVPVEAARSLGARRVLVSDVTGHASDTLNPGAPLVVADRLINWLFRQPADSLGPGDLALRLPVDDFAALDFAPGIADTLIRIGRHVADSALSHWACAGRAGEPRPAPVLPHRITAVTSGDSATTALITSLLGVAPGTRLDRPHLERRLLALGDPQRFRELWLHPRGRDDTVSFHPEVRRLPRREAAIGLAYDNELGGRAWAGWLDRQLPVLRSEGTAIARAGRLSNALELSLRRASTLGRTDFTPVFTVGGSLDRIRRFDATGVELPLDDYRQATATVGIERTIGTHLRVSLVGLAMAWHETDPLTRQQRDDDAIGGRLLLERDRAEPSGGFRLDLQWTNRFRLARFNGRLQQRVGVLHVTEELEAGIGHALPIALTMPLGVSDGFPGLHLGERRGDRHGAFELAISHPVAGPLRLRLSGTVGKAVFADTLAGQAIAGFDTGRFFNGREWRAGGRFGLEADTPLGPVRVEYGWSTGGRNALFLRVGRWF